MKNASIYYSVGALLYCPANRENLADSIINERFGRRFSLALCLEDTIADGHVKEAEDVLLRSLTRIHEAIATHEFFLPKIFIRVRNSEQILHLYEKLKHVFSLVDGIIAPKFCPETADAYLQNTGRLSQLCQRGVYLLPILENPAMLHLQHRYDFLYTVREQLQNSDTPVLNIRVGGNDLCHSFGFRRNVNETIYDIHPVAQILSDIVTVFSTDYVVSGPVWEYFSGDLWEAGMRREVLADKACGFIGKTVIHPSQIAVVNDAYRVSRTDYEDACSIQNWDKDSAYLVSANQNKERMNEWKTHSNWAEKILFLSEIYGVEPAL